jgi:heat shock protein HslJ
MLCEDAVMASETSFVAAMTRVTAAARDGDTLVLTGDGVELRFIPVEPLPIGDIVDRVWALESIVEDGATRPAGGEPATVEYRSDGTFSGSTGCRSFTGRWLESQARIVATEMSMDQLDCPPELADQDGLVTTVVGQAQASVEGDMLRLTSRGDMGLVYRLLGDT